MLNRVVLVGRLVKDPDLRYTQSGKAVANFTIAVNEPFTNQNGERKVDFFDCVIWNKPAENLANYMSKGKLIGVDGSLRTRKYDNKEGKSVKVTEVLAGSVQFLESNKNNKQEAVDYPRTAPQTQSEPIDISDDDLPF
ncbi:single-stranded DNA-binding protein 2 [Halolactibacillus miurensis]|uniref:Single-stranded DNA-binding protein n=1 Tax=Halolactibacillus miurensis TaxID=306541 RepID=A0A1I6S0T7_9BACI|nr:single-stranded DNA-binding protein [Halolactibacillus miurensis]GEM04501.1 single-stranded DNA-binding protein 2 [Halolactibacillus miurensis]SFS70573.1 single-strand DNA-binding protein [Halolactibacillus miurensis]